MSCRLWNDFLKVTHEATCYIRLLLWTCYGLKSSFWIARLNYFLIVLELLCWCSCLFAVSPIWQIVRLLFRDLNSRFIGLSWHFIWWNEAWGSGITWIDVVIIGDCIYILGILNSLTLHATCSCWSDAEVIHISIDHQLNSGHLTALKVILSDLLLHALSKGLSFWLAFRKLMLTSLRTK